MEQLLATKLFIPSIRPRLVARPQLIAQLNDGLHRKLTLVSAPAGFGKTTLVSEWARCLQADSTETIVSWLSLDVNDNDQVRFFSYFIAVLRKAEEIDSSIGKEALDMLQISQSISSEDILTSLINEIMDIPKKIIFVLDDYHLIESQSIHEALMFLLENLPPHLHLVITTREDPPLPLARLRARDQMTELRAINLRFSPDEAAEFLAKVMGLNLSSENIAALEIRTEGWIAGLQLAAISMRGHEDTASFISSFTGSHRLVLDYLIEEVLSKQPESIQTFLLQTAILDRFNSSLCDHLTGQNNGQVTLEALDHANLFIISLDSERRWYRYHHLFADLLRQRLELQKYKEIDVENLHHRASHWYENNGLELEAFHHAVAANDLERAEYLIEGNGMPLPFRGVVVPVLDWLESLPRTILDSRPSLWITYAMTDLTIGRTTVVEEKLQAAETVLKRMEVDGTTRDLFGRIANIRANLAVGHRQIETIITLSQRALEYLHPDNLTYRTAAMWKLGAAHEFQGDRTAAKQSYNEAITISERSGNIYIQVLAMTGKGSILEMENQLHLAVETYQQALKLVGDLPIPIAPHVHLCLARIAYEWNDLDAARSHTQECLQAAQPYKEHYDVAVACQVLLARMELAIGDVTEAKTILSQADQSARHFNFDDQLPEIATVKVSILLQQGNLEEAAKLADKHEIPTSQARVHLAQGDPSAALALLEPLAQQARAKAFLDEQLKVMVLEAVTQHACGEDEKAMQALSEALVLAKPGGFIRIFVDEGPLMAELLTKALSTEMTPDYVRQILAAFPGIKSKQVVFSKAQMDQSELIEPLSEREIDVLRLIAGGLTNQKIAARLFLSPNTVKAHVRNIFGKLGINNRTQAAIKARELGVIPPD
jgi:ATP/maltotriose-dependent transcriptional regulator MalT